MTVAKILGWMGASLLGIGAGLSSYAISNETRAPLKSLTTGVPPRGIAQGNAALALLAARRARDPSAGVNALELRLARQAYRAEPLNVSAITIQALAEKGTAEAELRWALLELAGKLTRRDSLTNMSLIEAAAKRGDDAKSFAWISRTMLTRSSAAMAYGKAMAAATARDGAVEALIDVLGPKPRWSNLYWQLILEQPNSYVNAAKLRIALTKAPWKQTSIESTDKDLVRVLANAGKFDEARQLASTLQPVRTAKGNLLANGNFSAEPSFAPFDWELSALGNLGASIDKDNRRLVISAIGGASGPAARQLVRLAPGNYRLGWVMSNNSPLPANAISTRIFCGEANGSNVPQIMIPLVAGKHQENVKIPHTDCQWRWLSIDVALPDDAMGADILVSALSLAPVP